MKLGEKIAIRYWIVFRVPGGWIYKSADAVTFVPFSEEFMNVSEKDLQDAIKL